MMSYRLPYILRLSAALLALASAPAAVAQEPRADTGGATATTAPDGPAASNRYERNFIVDGNRLYRQKRYAEAETMYKKALEQNPTSAAARYNLAALQCCLFQSG